MRFPMSRLLACAMVAVSAGVTGIAVRAVLAPPSNPYPYETVTSAAARREADSVAVRIGWAVLVLAGVAAAASSEWPIRIAGGLMAVAAGLLSAAPVGVWLFGTTGAALLLAVALFDRSIRRAAGE